MHNADIQNNTATKKNSSFLHSVFYHGEVSAIQLTNVKFFGNRFTELLFIRNNSSVIIQNSTVTENNVTVVGYNLDKNCTIELINVKFIRNSFLQFLFIILYNSNAIIQNNTLTETVSWQGYTLHENCTIQLSNVKFI